MSPALNGSSVLQHFERSNAIEIHNGIMFDFHPGLPHRYVYYTFSPVKMLIYMCWYFELYFVYPSFYLLVNCKLSSQKKYVHIPTPTCMNNQ